MDKCTYCDRESFTDSFIRDSFLNVIPLCEKHLEMEIYKARLEKQGFQVTVENIQRLMGFVTPIDVKVDEVPELLAQMQIEAVPA